MWPAYVKPYVKRQKNDATDAEAICEAVSRPNMRFVRTKTLERQSEGLTQKKQGPRWWQPERQSQANKTICCTIRAQTAATFAAWSGVKFV
jgi:transposase